MSDDRRFPSREPQAQAGSEPDNATLSNDDLLAAFMTLNIRDPTQDPEVARRLQSVLKELRRRGLEAEARRLSEENTRGHHRAR